MATFTIIGLDDVELDLYKQTEQPDKALPEMLEAGAKVLVAAAQSEASRATQGIGTLASSIGASGIRGYGRGRYIAVYPHGSQPHGYKFGRRSGHPSNTYVGYALEYGNSKTPARPWMSVAARSSTTAVQEAMKKVWEAKQNE